jgi:putative transposase
MARLPRLVLPGIPYHVTQRGNRRAQTFFEDGDYALYRDLLAQAAEKAGAEVWCYCLMPNHVHVIVVPSDEDGLRRTFADAHRRYTGFINARHRWTGHLWQGRFGAVAMDEDHLAAAVRYVSLNPVRARLVDRAQDWRWSSVAAHLKEENDMLVTVAPVLERYGRFADFLGDGSDDSEAWRVLRMSETSGRPLGGDEWLDALEEKSGRTLKAQKRGPKPKPKQLSVFSKLAP